MKTITYTEAEEKLKDMQGFNTLYVFIPDTREIYQIRPTDTGDNLLPEDREEGYNDYLYCQKQTFKTNAEGFGELTDEDVVMLYFNNEVEPESSWNDNIADAVIPFLREQFWSEVGTVVDFVPLFGE